MIGQLEPLLVVHKTIMLTEMQEGVLLEHLWQNATACESEKLCMVKTRLKAHYSNRVFPKM